jgi:hypothetical protein
MTSNPSKYRESLGFAIDMELLKDILYSFNKSYVLGTKRFKTR